MKNHFFLRGRGARVALVLGLAWAWQPGHAAEPTAPAPLRVGVTPNSPPVVFKRGDKVLGIEADFAAELGTALGRPVQFVELKWEKQIPALLDGKTDIVMSGLSITRARQSQVAFTGPYLRCGQMALVRRADRARYLLGMPSVLPGPVGVKKATTGEYWVEQEYPKAKRRTYKSGTEGAEALLAKKIDFFIADAPLVWWLAGTYESQGLTFLPQLLNQEEFAWAVRRSDAELLAAVNAYLARMESENRLTEILRRWLPASTQ